MQYLIENATLVSDGQKSKVSVLLEDNEIRSIGETLRPISVMKVDISSFILTPAHVVFAPCIPTLTFQEFKRFFTDEFLLKGYGTILTTFSIRHEFEFEDKLLEKQDLITE